jgi:D-3-phosphoglycerate dehydrogenase / 2-oxoglutarate reductase
MANLVYFENWMDPIGPETIATSTSIDLMKMVFADDPDVTWRVLEAAHGYQCLPSTETEERFYPGAELITRCPNLLAVSVSGAGYDMVDVDACTDAGVLVVNQTGANAESVAQHVIGLMLCLTKQIIQTDRAIHRTDRSWTRWDYAGNELTGRTLGIVGLGKIGRRLSEIAKVFSMNVIAYDPYITAEDFSARGATSVALEDLLAKSDFVSINCPLTAETKGMIGAPEFEAMKSNSIFISTARGGIHDEVALEKAIATKRLAGAGVDVFNAEPPAHDHPLMRFENVIASPHNAGVTTDCMFNMAKWAADQWINIFNGKRPPRFINPEVWPKFSERYSAIMGRPVSE